MLARAMSLSLEEISTTNRSGEASDLRRRGPVQKRRDVQYARKSAPSGPSGNVQRSRRERVRAPGNKSVLDSPFCTRRTMHRATTAVQRRRKHSISGFCNCPQQHALRKFYAVDWKTQYRCDECNTVQPFGSVLFGCRTCDHDVCLECYTKHPSLPYS